MTTETDFLASIHAEPDDVMNKLVFADWLEDHGDPRAGLVRAMVAGQGSRTFLAGAAAARLRRLTGVSSLTLDPRGLVRVQLKSVPPPEAVTQADAWGWVTEIEVNRIGILRQLRQVFERLPLLRRLTLRPVSSQLGGWMQVPFPDRAVEVRLVVDTGRRTVVEHLRNLAVWLPADRLRELVVSSCGLNNDGAARLASASGLEGLRKLDLSRNVIGPDGIRELAATPALRNLEWLSLEYNPIQRAGLEALLEPGRLPSLREVKLNGTQIGLDGIALWLRSRLAPPPGSDIALRIGFEFHQTFTPAGLRVAIHGAAVEEVDQLLPDGTAELKLQTSREWQIGDAARLFALPALARLRALALWAPQYTPNGVHEILAHPVGAGLEELSLGGLLGPDLFAEVLSRPRLEQLKRLELNAHGNVLRFEVEPSAIRLVLLSPHSWMLDALATAPDLQRVTAVQLIAPGTGTSVRLARLLPAGVVSFGVSHTRFLFEAELREMASVLPAGQLRELRLPLGALAPDNPLRAELRERFPLVEETHA
jgi:uncharacterized protein (TIGR02996 family)